MNGNSKSHGEQTRLLSRSPEHDCVMTPSAKFVLEEHVSWKMAWTSASVIQSPPCGVVIFRIVLLLSWVGVTSWSAVLCVQKKQSFGRWASYLTNWGLMWELAYLSMAALVACLALSPFPDATGNKTPWFARVAWAMQVPARDASNSAGPIHSAQLNCPAAPRTATPRDSPAERCLRSVLATSGRVRRQ